MVLRRVLNDTKHRAGPDEAISPYPRHLNRHLVVTEQLVAVAVLTRPVQMIYA